MDQEEKKQDTDAAVAEQEKQKTNFSDFSSLSFGDGEKDNISGNESGEQVDEGKKEGEGTVEQDSEGDKTNGGQKTEGEQGGSAEGIEGGAEKESSAGEENIFSDENIFLDSGEQDKEGEGTSETQIDWKTQGMKMGLEFEDNTEEAFNAAYEEKINSARQELNLDNYDPLTKDIISFVNDKKGDPLDFILSDDLLEARRFLRQSDEQKYRDVRFEEIYNSDRSKTEEEIESIIDDELEKIDDASFSRIITNINNTVKGIEKKAIDAIIQKKSEQAEKDKVDQEEQAKEKRNSLKTKISSINSFVGFKFPDQLKNILLSQIDNGEVERFINSNQEEVMLYGYLHLKYGDRVAKSFNEKIKSDARESYNKGIERSQREQFNIPDKETVQTGHASPKVNISNKPNWKDQKID